MGRDQNGFSQVSVIVAKSLHTQLTYPGVFNGNGRHSGFKSPLSQLMKLSKKKEIMPSSLRNLNLFIPSLLILVDNMHDLLSAFYVSGYS